MRSYSLPSRSSAIDISSDSEDGLCMDCACIVGNRMHSMHAHGLCMHTVAVAQYTKRQAANISQLYNRVDVLKNCGKKHEHACSVLRKPFTMFSPFSIFWVILQYFALKSV